MKTIKILLLFLPLAIFAAACSQSADAQKEQQPPKKAADSIYIDSSAAKTPAKETETPKTTFINVDSLLKQNDSVWVDMEDIAPDMVFDIRYATTNNFVGEVMYDCPKCYLRVATARATLKVHNELKTKHNYKLKMYDCYRPLSVQRRLWKKVPDKKYVAPPDKGSQHNRGLAIDLTIVDEKGEELPMGTTFDFFGKEAIGATLPTPPTSIKIANFCAPQWKNTASARPQPNGGTTLTAKKALPFRIINGAVVSKK